MYAGQSFSPEKRKVHNYRNIHAHDDVCKLMTTTVFSIINYQLCITSKGRSSLVPLYALKTLTQEAICVIYSQCLFLVEDYFYYFPQAV